MFDHLVFLPLNTTKTIALVARKSVFLTLNTIKPIALVAEMNKLFNYKNI